jgi:uncharacterized membrane protein
MPTSRSRFFHWLLALEPGSSGRRGQGAGLPAEETLMSPAGRALWIALAAGSLLLGCSTGDRAEADSQQQDAGAGGCPHELPSACASAPSYQAQIAPIVAARCATCHAPGGVEASKPLDTYAALHARRGSVLDQVYNCLMPLPGAPPLTTEERAALLGWLVCDAPEN